MEPDKEKNNRPKKEESREKPQPPRESDSEIENIIELDEPSQDIKKKKK